MTSGGANRGRSARPPPVAPSDPLELGAVPVRVGGRIIDSRADLIVLADAIGSLTVRLETELELHPGELVVVEITGSKNNPPLARLVERFDGRIAAAGSEFHRLAVRGIGQHLAARARALATIRCFFDEHDFLEVDTMIRVPSPGLDAHVDAVRAEDGWLITSPEHQMKRLLVGGLPRIYQLVHTTRANEQGRLHEPEFMMLEWYRAFAGQEEIMRDTEQLVRKVLIGLSGADRVSVSGRSISLAEPFERMSVADAFREYASVPDAVDLAGRDSDSFFEALVDSVEPALAERDRPVFLTDYPISQAALARAQPHDPRLAERFELYVGGVELCNGYGELTDPVEQRRRFEQELARRRREGAPLHPIDERFLEALAEGMPPSGGNALGVDRLVGIGLGVDRIEDVMTFSRSQA